MFNTWIRNPMQWICDLLRNFNFSFTYDIRLLHGRFPLSIKTQTFVILVYRLRVLLSVSYSYLLIALTFLLDFEICASVFETKFETWFMYKSKRNFYAPNFYVILISSSAILQILVILLNSLLWNPLKISGIKCYWNAATIMSAIRFNNLIKVSY